MISILTKEIRQRSVQPEILDELPIDDPGAAAARRDLVFLNRLMFNARFVSALLRKHVAQPPRRLLDIGAGDGRFMLSVARRLARLWPGVEVVLLDRADIISPQLVEAFGKLGWRAEGVAADVFEWADSKHASFDAITANFFLHHFDDAALRRLFVALQPVAPVLLTAEPCRAAFPLFATPALRLLGASAVTRHDAPASIRAGFTGKEISAQWQAAGGMPIEERRAGLFTHVFAGASARRS